MTNICVVAGGSEGMLQSEVAAAASAAIRSSSIAKDDGPGNGCSVVVVKGKCTGDLHRRCIDEEEEELGQQ